MSRVFLIEEPRANLDVSGAARFGTVTILFGPTDRRHSVFNTNAYSNDVLQRLEEHDFDYQKDYICVTGSMVPIVIAMLTIAVAHPFINVLFYNAAEGEYTSRVVNPGEWKGYSNDQRMCLAGRGDAGQVSEGVQPSAGRKEGSRQTVKGRTR